MGTILTTVNDGSRSVSEQILANASIVDGGSKTSDMAMVKIYQGGRPAARSIEGPVSVNVNPNVRVNRPKKLNLQDKWPTENVEAPVM